MNEFNPVATRQQTVTLVIEVEDGQPGPALWNWKMVLEKYVVRHELISVDFGPLIAVTPTFESELEQLKKRWGHVK